MRNHRFNPDAYAERIRKNEIWDCNVDECEKKRYRLASYCRAHEARYYRHGHAKMYQIRKKEFNYERELVKKIIHQNRESVAVQAAIKVLRSLLEHAGGAPFAGNLIKHESSATRKHANRLLYDAELINILIEICAMRLYIHRGQLKVSSKIPPQQLKIEQIAIGTAALYTVRLGKVRSPSGTVRARFGFLIQIRLGNFVANVVTTALKHLAKQEQIKTAMQSPLELPTN
ncbi:MAG: hypothetical protein ACRBDX_10570 [Gammaproteobacteria bacterium]